MDYTTVNNNLDKLDKDTDNLNKNLDSFMNGLNTKVNNINNKIFINLSSITLDSFVLDGTTLTNVEFENVGNGIFLSKYILKRQSMDALLVGSSTNDVGNGNIGKAVATSIEASLRRQFGDSVSLKTYTRTYDGATHNEKVFLPLECEVHGLTQYSADTATLSKYPQWSIPNNKIKTEINNTSNAWRWWCANKSSISGTFCYVTSYGLPNFDRSYADYLGVALAFCL